MSKILESNHMRENFKVKPFHINRRRVVCGFGVVDADYEIKPRINGVQSVCPAYQSWRSMIDRCYSSVKQSKSPTYNGVNVCDEWRSFMAFRSWWVENYIDGWHLDKDILSSGSKIYSPDTSLFIPRWLNNMLIDCNAARGDLPIGVRKTGVSFGFRCRIGNGVRLSKGGFETPELALDGWKEAKSEYARKMKDEMDSIDVRIYGIISEIINTKK